MTGNRQLFRFTGMNKVFVLDREKNPLMPCHPARARQLLDRKRAKVFRLHPFTIILQDRAGGAVQPVEIKLDPGSKITGIAITVLGDNGRTLVWSCHLSHRGCTIKDSLQKRRGIRRSRRHRHCRYRQPRFDNVFTWVKRLLSWTPGQCIHVETVRFDTQKLMNPEISGAEYQQGELQGYEVREYLLEKFHRTCVYCGLGNRPLEVEHVVAKANGGSNRVSNLALSCRDCNERKGTQRVEDFVTDPVKLERLRKQLKTPLKDATAVNATRYAIGNKLKNLGLPVRFWSGGRTKMNRIQQGYGKDHFIDAACVGDTGSRVFIPEALTPLTITAKGRGNRQMCLMDKFGFPRTRPKGVKQVDGFTTGDSVRLNQPRGKYRGSWTGSISIRASRVFDITTRNKEGKNQKISASSQHFIRLQGFDGYVYG